MTLLQTLIAVFAFSSAAMILVWLWALKIRNIGIVDVAWAALMGIAGLFCAYMGTGSFVARAALAVFAGIWSLRLFLSLLQRVRHEPEDGRYQALRAEWNGSPSKFFVFFQGQALVVSLFTLPFFAAAENTSLQPGLWLYCAIGFFCLSLLGETIADRQLATFRNNPGNRGITCRTGLWAWSRHPNYFFEWLHWFAYVCLAVGGTHFAMSWVGPVLMLAFLYRVSGIPWTEAQALRSRGDNYRRYQREVSAFFPLPPNASSKESL